MVGRVYFGDVGRFVSVDADTHQTANLLQSDKLSSEMAFAKFLVHLSDDVDKQ